MIQVLQRISEITVPRPGMVVKDKRTGEYGKVEYFRWKGGEAVAIPVKMDDGRTERLTYFTFPRRYDLIDSGSPEYRTYQEIRDIDKQLAEREKELHNVTVTLQSSRLSMKDLPHLAKVAMGGRISKLEIEQDNLGKEIARLRNRRAELV